MSVSLPSLRVDAFSVGIASEIQKVRRTGLTFAPEAGSWRLRQVINKLILEDDLYSAVDGCVLAGLAAREAVLPHRAADRDGRRHAGDREARERTSSTSGAGTPSRRAAPCRWAASCRSRTRRSSGSGRTASTSCGARSRCCATTLKGTRAQRQVARPRRDVRRGHRVAAATAGSAGSSNASGGPAARSRSGASTSRSTAGSTRCRPRASTPTGTSPGTAPPTRSSRGTTSRPGLHRDFLWDDWQAALAEHGLPDCRWTPCYDCGVCTDYALEHVVASPVRARGRQQGTGQDLGCGGEVPVAFLGSKPVER